MCGCGCGCVAGCGCGWVLVCECVRRVWVLCVDNVAGSGKGLATAFQTRPSTKPVTAVRPQSPSSSCTMAEFSVVTHQYPGRASAGRTQTRKLLSLPSLTARPSRKVADPHAVSFSFKTEAMPCGMPRIKGLSSGQGRGRIWD
jgi:hypothetical protein